MKPNFSGFSFDTICTHDDFFTDPIAHIQPIYAGSTFVYESPEKAMDVFAGKEDAFIYARWSNPNAALVEAKITALETLGLSASPKSALLFSTGMAAISAALESVITPNSMVIAQQDMYGATVELLSDLSKRYPSPSYLQISQTQPNFLLFSIPLLLSAWCMPKCLPTLCSVSTTYLNYQTSHIRTTLFLW